MYKLNLTPLLWFNLFSFIWHYIIGLYSDTIFGHIWAYIIMLVRFGETLVFMFSVLTPFSVILVSFPSQPMFINLCLLWSSIFVMILFLWTFNAVNHQPLYLCWPWSLLIWQDWNGLWQFVFIHSNPHFVCQITLYMSCHPTVPLGNGKLHWEWCKRTEYARKNVTLDDMRAKPYQSMFIHLET